MKILLTAKKGLGKSTVIENFVKHWSKPVSGFIVTRMKDRNGLNQGFLAKTFDGRTEILSHKKLLKSDYVVGDNHKVDVDVIDNFLVPEILNGLKSDNLIIIDEIGRMEAISKKFLDTIRLAINSNNNLLAAIVYEDEPWSSEFKKHPDVKIIEVTLENRDRLPEELLKLLSE